MRSRVVGGAIAAAALSLLAACGGGSDHVGGVRLGTVPATSTTVGGPAAADLPGQATTTTRSPAAVTTGSGGGVAAGSGGAAAAGPASSTGLLPPAAGTYAYDTTGTSTFALTTMAYPAVSTLVVDAPLGTHQHSTRDLRDAAGNGPVLELSLDYRPDGIYVEAITLTSRFAGVTNSQPLRPPSPQLLVPTDARPGTHLEYDLSSGGATAHLVIDISGRENVTVGGHGVDALAVHMVASLPPGAVTGQVDLTVWLAPSVRLWVKEHFVLDAAAAGGALTLHSRYDATLQRLP